MISLTQSSSSSDSYCVKWKSQQLHIFEGLRNLVGNGHDGLTDVILACDGEYINAHKLVLSLCSTFFKDLFQKNRADKSNTIVILGNVKARNMRYLLRYMYEGKVEIPKRHVDSFLQAGNMLKVDGLVKNVDEDSEQIKPIAVNTYDRRCWPKTSFGLFNHKRRLLSRSSKRIIVNVRTSSPPPSKRDRKTESGDDNENGANDDRVCENESDKNGQGEVEDDENIARAPKIEPVQSDDVHESESESSNDAFMPTTDDRDLGTSFSNPIKNVSPPSREGDQERRRHYTFKPKLRRNRSSLVWKVFRADHASTSAKCMLCKDRDIIFKTTKGCTSSLLRHILQVHPGILKTCPPRSRYYIANNAPIPTSTPLVNDPDPLPSTSSISTSAQNVVPQPPSSAVEISLSTPKSNAFTTGSSSGIHNSPSQFQSYQTSLPSNNSNSEIHELLQSSYNVLNDTK